jgi:hypothetical protein
VDSAETWRRADADPPGISLGRSDRAVQVFTRLLATSTGFGAEAAVLVMRLAVELFHMGGRLAATVRPALDAESLSAPFRHLHDGSCPMSNERKQDG